MLTQTGTPHDPTPEDIALAKSVLTRLRDRETNGESLELALSSRNERKLRFDGSINLGHILTIVAMVCSVAILWANSRVTTANHEQRITTLEASRIEMQNAFTKMAEASQSAALSQQRLSLQMEDLLRDRGIRPK